MISRRSSGIAKRSRVSGFSVPHFALSITRFIGSALAVSPASQNTSLLPFQAGWFFLLLRGILFRAFYILGTCAVCQTVSSFSVHCVRIECGQSALPTSALVVLCSASPLSNNSPCGVLCPRLLGVKRRQIHIVAYIANVYISTLL